MKNRFKWLKTAQLILLLAATAAGLTLIFTDDRLYQMIGSDPSVRALCALLWLVLGLSYLAVLMDLRTLAAMRRDYRELDYAVYNDRVAGIANRFSCDAMIEKYMDRPVPDTMGCVMLDLTNIRQINDQLGHMQGNQAIQSFSDMLHGASLGLCFVGRNGGNKFMALFEDCDDEKLNAFLTRVQQSVEKHNLRGDAPELEYRTGRAFAREDPSTTITQLIALADRRLASQTDRVTGFANRASCDDVIDLYSDKPLPDSIGCAMLELSNIRQINDAAGHRAGNQAIRRFGDILREASAGLCFVGRNGGTKFLALFENCDETTIPAFLDRVRAGVERYNARTGEKIEYRWGEAFREGPEIATIHRLVALSDRRLREKADRKGDEHGPSGR